MHIDLSIHPTDRWGLNPPDKCTMIHMCCVFSGYQGVAAHVKQNHDIYGTAHLSQALVIQSRKRTWSISAEAYEAEARDFGISCPRYTLPAIIQRHLNYEGPKLNADYAGLSQDPLVLRPVTTPSNGVEFPLRPLGPHHSLALVQQSQSPPGFESVVHTVAL